MEFRVLGPLEAVIGGHQVPLGGIKQRATLGLLLLHANHVVPTSDLLSALWSDNVPPTARKMLQNAVSGLRGMLAMGEGEQAPALLLTHAPGYILHVEPASLDLVRFRELVDEGRAELRKGAWEPAARRLREALPLWRGPALADLAETGIAWPELTALKDSRLSALEDCYEAELAVGRHRELISELTELVETEPSRERLCGQLMLALYRDGRQVDALDAFRRTRAELVERLGLEPGRELRELERAILNQDPRLQTPASTDSVRFVNERDNAGSPGGPDQRAETPSASTGLSISALVAEAAVADTRLEGRNELLADASRSVASGPDGNTDSADVISQLNLNTLPGRTTVIDVQGELDVGAVTAFRAFLVDTVTRQRPQRVVLDMRRVTFMDSTSIGALVAAYNAARETDVEFVIHDPSRFVRQELEMTGLAELFGIPSVVAGVHQGADDRRGEFAGQMVDTPDR
jgi:anti-anti-sigma factor